VQEISTLLKNFFPARKAVGFVRQGFILPRLPGSVAAYTLRISMCSYIAKFFMAEFEILIFDKE
jgi:hypothetical protein